MIMAKRSLPAAKLAVPSRGSTIQQASPGRPIRSTRPGSFSTASSPTTGTPGRILAKPTARRCSEATSATVTTSPGRRRRSEEHTSELQSRQYLVCRLLLEKKKKKLVVDCYVHDSHK